MVPGAGKNLRQLMGRRRKSATNSMGEPRVSRAITGLLEGACEAPVAFCPGSAGGVDGIRRRNEKHGVGFTTELGTR